MAILTPLEELRLKLLEKQLGVPVTEHAADVWLERAIDSEIVAKSGRRDIEPEWWLETSRLQFKAAEFAEKLAQSNHQ